MKVLTRVWYDASAQYGEIPFLYDEDRMYTNREAIGEAERIRDILLARGLKPGERVVVSMPNRAEVLMIYQGAMMAGATIVPVLYLLGESEMMHIFANAEPRAVFCDRSAAAKALAAGQSLGIAPWWISVDRDTDGFEYLGDLPVTETVPDPPLVQEDDIAVILYTSGTTGNPKGVMLTHQNLYGNARQVIASGEREERTVTLGVLPLAHIFGFTVSTVTAMLGGAIVIFRKWDVEQVFAAIERYRVRSFSAVPAMIYAMVHSPFTERYDLSSLESVSSGSAPLPVPLLEAFRERFGAEVYEGYGLSEAAPVVSGHRRGMPVKPGTVGVPIEGVEVKIVDFEGRDVPVGEVGELWVRGENVTPGYYRNPDATAQVLRPGGWLATGDMARRDPDGYLTIVDRKKDVIIRGGFNIYPRDLEEVLLRHPSVAEAAVVGVPSERLGEEPVAFIVPRPGQPWDEMELIRYCAERLARYKVPRAVYPVDALPRNGVGKVLKTTLRQWAQTDPS